MTLITIQLSTMSLSGSINVINRKGEIMPLHLETISKRLNELAQMPPKLNISTDIIAIKTASSLIDGIKTSEIDNISAGICASLIVDDYEYDTLAARIIISSLHKITNNDLRMYAKSLRSYDYRDTEIKILHPKTIAFILENSKDLHDLIDYQKDYSYNYFGAITLINSYLLAYKYDNNQKITKERPQQMLLRVAIGIHLDEINDDGTCEDGTFTSISETYKLLSDKYYTHATPTLFNAGTINHTLSSCYLLSVDDSLENIYGRLTDISKISKFSGGVGIHVSQVRAQGSVIASTIGRSEGLVPMLRVFNESTKYVSQGGGKRKGSTAVYVEPWHADIESCILSQKQQGIPEKLCRDLFLALWIPDLFMERLKESIKTGKPVMWSLMCPNECKGLPDVYGDEFKHLYESYEKQKKYRKQIPIVSLWNLIVSTQIETGKPYIMYKDHVNRKCNQNNCGTIKSSNLCVAGNTKILTKVGYQEIRELAGRNVEVWNGSEWSLAPVAQTGTNQKLLKVTTDDGCSLECTPYHRFRVLSKSRQREGTCIKEASELKPNDMLIKCDYPIVDGTEPIKYPYTHGLFCADGSYPKPNVETTAVITLCSDEKKALLPYLDRKMHLTPKLRSNGYMTVHLPTDIAPKYYVPINASFNDKLQWLAGFIDGDGCLANGSNIQMSSIHKEFLTNIKLMCQTMGLNPKIRLNHNGRFNELPDGAGGQKMYYSNPLWVLYFSKYETAELYNELELPTKRIIFDPATVPTFKSTKYVKITSIDPVEGLHDTYCFNEPKKHMGVFNGIISMNCSEITIYSDDKQVGVCNLASVCLPKFVVKGPDGQVGFDYKKLNKVVQRVVYNMNKVMDNNKYPIEQAAYSDNQNRPIGIGVQGLAEVFMMMKQPYDSPMSRIVNSQIFETMYFAALTASNKLSQLDGPYKTFKTSMTNQGTFQYDLWDDVILSKMWDWADLKHKVMMSGLRNSLLMCIMPTAGTSIIMEHTESVEVPQSNIFTRSTLSGRFQVVNKHLMKDLKDLGLWTREVRNQLIQDDGSVANIQSIPQKIRDIYKTVYEYKISHMIEMCADREAFICQSSSNNRFVVDPSVSKLTKMHLYSWKMGLKTSSYYVRCKQLVTGKKLLTQAPAEEDVACLSCTA